MTQEDLLTLYGVKIPYDSSVQRGFLEPQGPCFEHRGFKYRPFDPKVLEPMAERMPIDDFRKSGERAIRQARLHLVEIEGPSRDYWTDQQRKDLRETIRLTEQVLTVLKGR